MYLLNELRERTCVTLERRCGSICKETAGAALGRRRRRRKKSANEVVFFFSFDGRSPNHFYSSFSFSRRKRSGREWYTDFSDGMQQHQQEQQQRDSSSGGGGGGGGEQGRHPPNPPSSSPPMMPPRPPSSPDPSLVLLSPAQARRLLDDARGLASEGRPVAALQALLAALAALGAPSAALQVFGRAVEALTLRREGEGGGGGGGGAGAGAEAAGGQRGERAAAEVSAPLPSSSLASLLASLSLEASTRLGALEGEKTGEGEGGSMALDGGAGPTPHPAAAAAAAVPALLSEEAAARADGASVRCGECGAVVAATRAEAHSLFWCSSLGGGSSGRAERGD